MKQEYDVMMEKSQRVWQSCLDTTTKLKFEELRTRHQLEITELLIEIKNEKKFREE